MRWLDNRDGSARVWTLAKVQGGFVLRDGWSQQRSQPIIICIQLEWGEFKPSDLGGVHSPLVWDIGWGRVHLGDLHMFVRQLRDMGGSLVGVGRSIGVNVPKAWKIFEVTHSTWSTLDGSLGWLRSVGMLATLIADVELQRGDLKIQGELRTCLGLEDC